MGEKTTATITLALLMAGLPAAASGQEAMEAEKKYTIRFETTEHKRYCKASLLIRYNQYDTIAAYDGEIVNEDCGPSSGTYTISVRYRDESGEVHNMESEFEWQRADDQKVVFSGEQHIGANVDLVRVRASKVQCVCDDVESPAPELESRGKDE